MPTLLDAGGPMLLVFYGGAVVAAVLGTVGVVYLGLWLARRAGRAGRSDEFQDPEVPS